MSKTYDIGGLVSTPTADYTSGNYGSSISVSLSTTTSGATIYYTDDGSTPTDSSTLYVSAISVSTTKTIKAITVKSNWVNSGTMIRNYSFNTLNPSANYPGGIYNNNLNIVLSDNISGATIHYTTNGNTPDINSPVYSSSITISSSTTLKFLSVKNGYTNSPVVTESYSFVVAIPSASVHAGLYNFETSVALSTVTTGSTIYYTLDGNTPTTSSPVYSNPINIDTTNTTLKFFAVKANYTSSGIIVESTYDFITAPPVVNPPSGNYAQHVRITINSNTPDANLYYTLDGSTPTTNSTPYTGPFYIYGTTVTALALKSGWQGTSSGEESQGDPEEYDIDQILLCWRLTGKYYNSTKLFQLDGDGHFPEEITIPSSVDPDTVVLIDEGVEIDRSKYQLIINGSIPFNVD
jgi:hypothetical protein